MCIRNHEEINTVAKFFMPDFSGQNLGEGINVVSSHNVYILM